MVATLGQVSTTQEATRLARLVEATDAEIDRHVFRLYGPSEDEAQMIEAERPKDRSEHPRQVRTLRKVLRELCISSVHRAHTMNS
ncbi:MAG TPA: hypothetical protein VJ258_04160 [Candidatus Limnocylindrales bacterium]|nr:hypothetical protein [Candidatus Limnocylindrales bacterium]